MNLIERAKNILFTPKTEWDVINGETASLSSLLTSYVIPLALIPTIAKFLNLYFWTGWLLGTQYIVISAIIAFVDTIIAYVVATYVVDMLANNFKSEKNIGKSAQLVAYSCTAIWVAGILSIIPVLGWLALIAGAGYAVYLMYLGTGPLKKTPEDQRIVYVIIIIVILIVVNLILSAIFGAIFFAGTVSSVLQR